MRLALSSAAAPEASFDQLIDACVRRGITALELETGHGHPTHLRALSPEVASEARARAAAAGIQIAGLRVSPAHGESGPTGISDFDCDALLELSLSFDAPLLIPAGWVVPSSRLFDTGRVMAVLSVGPEAFRTPDALDAGERLLSPLPLALDVDPATAGVSAASSELLARVGPRVRHLRLYGGGPEASGQEGRGVGALVTRLALMGFTGIIALAPSSPQYRVIWDAWLGRRGGWGCGSKERERELVSLTIS